MPEATTPLPIKIVTEPDLSLHFRAMAGHEEMSRLFEYEVVVRAEDAAVDFDSLLGTYAGVSFEVAEGSFRWFNGIVAAAGIEDHQGAFHDYRLVLRPWLWLATQSSNLRVFQEMTAPDIIKEVLGTYGGTVTDELSGTYATRTYCVQYRESDFNFVSRLMEEEGIFYFFRHVDGDHELVLGDAASSNVAATGFETIRFVEGGEGSDEDMVIRRWRMRHEIQSGKFTLRDYNFETPSDDLTSTSAETARTHAEATHEVYDYPGLYGVKADGDARALVRLAEADARHARFTGQGNSPGLVCGGKFTLSEHKRDDQNADYLVLSTRIELQLAEYEATDAGGQTRYTCDFVAQKHADVFRPARLTRKPAVAGPQTAKVVGDGDPGDIITDEHARVKIKFHWDRLGADDGTSSCWVRVASPMAGNGWGFISIPRLGQEVVVDFLEGDPDQPLITGRVHNPEQLPPYLLPDNAAVTTLKSRSKLAGADAFNELRFDDTDGSELLLLHAQKDRFEFVEETLKSTIGMAEHRHVKEDRKEHVEGKWHLKVTGDVLHKYEAKWHLAVAQDMLLKTDAKFNLKTGADILIDGGAKFGLKTGADIDVKGGGNLGVDASTNVHIKGGANVVIEAGSQLSIKAGGSSVVLGPDGVSITGSMVKVNSGGSPGSGNGASPGAPTEPDAPEDPELPEDPLADAHR
ncbi:MAG: type VI secretion system tip protein VgrG [Rubrivivax sp.]|nr:type VI secretion system tip protein VgrG [Rubrivivax sp.]